ncbi:hypothetical protein [Campylobacter geochelonis]|uniref:hypothetical protein n=1 Tax=Campylobacter geochelonis TaxID=1780362 RepID=UPI000770AF68|nr:hypothetical protein [Campylobacter geochelonis]CZE48397.1 Uncharacterised protein [Campylobacter geochelonis]
MSNFSRSNYIKDKVQKYSANIAGIVKNYNDPVGLAKELTDLFKNAISIFIINLQIYIFKYIR